MTVTKARRFIFHVDLCACTVLIPCGIFRLRSGPGASGLRWQGEQSGHEYVGQFPAENIDTLAGNLLLTFTDFAFPRKAGLDKIQRSFNSGGRIRAGAPRVGRRPGGTIATVTGEPRRLDRDREWS